MDPEIVVQGKKASLARNCQNVIPIVLVYFCPFHRYFEIPRSTAHSSRPCRIVTVLAHFWGDIWPVYLAKNPAAIISHIIRAASIYWRVNWCLSLFGTGCHINCKNEGSICRLLQSDIVKIAGQVSLYPHPLCRYFSLVFNRYQP